MQPDAKTVVIAKAEGAARGSDRDAAKGLQAVPKERQCNLVPGLECLALEVAMELGKDVVIRIEALAKA